MRLARFVLGVLSFALSGAAPAFAVIPIPHNATLPACIPLVAVDAAGMADPHGEFQVTARDIAGNLVPNAQVIIDFSDCPDIRFAATQPFTGLHVECPSHAVWALTDWTGKASFRIAGRAVRASGSAGLKSVKVFVDGVLYPGLSATTYDQDGASGVAANDLALWLTDCFAGIPVGRSDYDGSGALGANDLSIWMTDCFSGWSTRSAGSLPGGLCP